ncbi:MAG: AIR carboxylase family protein [Holophagales bacterium]|nr:AIR carboxylase family protein [Holophagales bacterium]
MSGLHRAVDLPSGLPPMAIGGAGAINAAILAVRILAELS